MNNNINELLFSIVTPVYNSEISIGILIDKTQKAFEKWNLKYQLILVNDGSTDKSWEIISSRAKDAENIIGINLLKNYGQHNALMCGFKHASGDYIITIDDDLQNPPEEIIKLINEIIKGYDLVIGRFEKKKHAMYRIVGSKLVWHINQKIFKFPKDLKLSNFRIVRRDVIERVINYKTGFPYIPGLLLMLSGMPANVLVEHHKRECGKSNYNLFQIFKLVLTILFTYSSYPLRVVGILGGFISLCSLSVAVFVFISSLIYGTSVPGWSALAIMLSFINGIALLMLSMIGEYIIRLVNQVSSPESYYVSDIIKK